MLAKRHVAPFAGAWIEITKALPMLLRLMSLRSPERGLKLCLCCCVSVDSGVAPFAGAWIEIDLQDIMLVKNYVAPFAGAWIEIAVVKCNMQYRGSLCSPERGLK